MSKPQSILIVDDTAENLTVLRDILAHEGYRVRPVLQGALALKSAAADPPDLILLDIMMPGMDGYETCERLKADEKTRDIPVLFISALDGTESKVHGFEVGALDYIIKPFRAGEVLARVRTHLALQEARQRLVAQNVELRQAASLREDVDRMLRHDLRGSLAGVIGFSELIIDELGPENESAEHARVIAGAGYAMLSMIHSSFDLMKMERGVYEAKAEIFDLVEVVRQVVSEHGLTAEQKSLRFRYTFAETSDEDALVRGERLLCHSLFHNLVKNAIEASPPGRSVEFRFGLKGECTEISIRNAGVVPEGIRGRFFDKFVTEGKTDGTGFGTYSARLMAETQQGSVRLDCSELGHTTIFVALPHPTPAESAQFRTARSQAQSDHVRRFSSIELPAADVLIADDDPASRAYLKRILPTPPLRLSFATNGNEALARLCENSLAVAFIDLEMPGMNGVELVQAFRAWQRARAPGTASRPPTPVLIGISGHHDPVTRERCREAGFDRLLTKPVAKRKLYDELKQALSPGSAVVHLDPAIRDLIPDFVASQNALLKELEGFVAMSDGGRLRSLAHRLQGSFAMYGFETASRLSTAIEAAGKSEDFRRARILIDDLRAHLRRLEIRFA